MDIDKKIIETEKEKVMYDFNIGFIAGFIVLFGDFLGDYFKEEFNFNYYYFIKIFIPFVGYLLFKIYVKTRKG